MMRWSVGFVLCAICLQLALADVRGGVQLSKLDRIKRSPQYYNRCPSYYPPPPPPYWRRPHFWGGYPALPPPPLPPPPYPEQHQAFSAANADSNKVPEAPCTTCGDKDKSSAISNAESQTGQAVAVAIARASNN